VCGDELLDLAQTEAAIEEAGRRLSQILIGEAVSWVPIGFVPEAFKAPASFTVTYTPACRICERSGHLACPAHGPFRPRPELPPFRTIGSC